MSDVLGEEGSPGGLGSNDLLSKGRWVLVLVCIANTLVLFLLQVLLLLCSYLNNDFFLVCVVHQCVAGRQWHGLGICYLYRLTFHSPGMVLGRASGVDGSGGLFIC